MHECRRRAADNRIAVEVALADRDGVALVAVFRRNEPPCTIFLDGSADRAAELFAGEMRGRLIPVEGRQCLQHFVPKEDET